ncbi:M15 family metallopeptidase [Alkalibacterium sp. MB6]|uniref:M15 family metallopeptidase n=1 Tax=Alkalibacterium sp. MB6 TaxID=2081965 RepID=UPI00137952A0|nr:M15 family metallopeptidase [Alkalibacterium sp. MB6]
MREVIAFLYRLTILAVLGSVVGCQSIPTDPNESPSQSQIDEGQYTVEREGEEVADNETIDESPSVFLKEDIFEPSSTAVLVNKQHPLSDSYEPDDLVLVEVPTVLESVEIRQLRQVAADSLKEMFDAAEEEGIILLARSGYRSYHTQVQLFNNYVEQHGEEAANRYSARPGESEHQTGLAMDVTSESVAKELTEAFGETEEGLWVKENAHHFGFIIRYPEGKESITGYIYEPWHLRYLGQELATAVYDSGLTYEEFLVEEGIDSEIHQ